MIRLLAALTLVLLVGGCTAPMDWWLTPDQQGYRYYQRGEFANAARAFEDPVWKGRSFYAAEEFASAVAVFSRLETAEGYFYAGNAYAQQSKLAEAVDAYSRALALDDKFGAARFNLDWVSGLLEIEQTEYDDAGGTGGQLKADEFVFDDRAANAQQIMTETEARAHGLSDSEIESLWMRRVQTTPGEFLEYKFAFQAQDSEASP